MATKLQMKQRCKELEELLAQADDKVAVLENTVSNLNDQLVRKADNASMWWGYYQNEQRRAQFYYKCLSKIRHILALDTLEQFTHRQRNEKLRALVGTLAHWMDTTLYDTQDTDDIPF